METNSMRISSQSRRYAKVQNLMHNVNEQNLMAQHRHQKLHKAPGIDKVDKQRYETHVNENIGKLVQEMKKYNTDHYQYAEPISTKAMGK